MKVITYLLFLVVSTGIYALENNLRNHPSPYLAMHGKDPVAWQEWNESTVELAKKTNRLLFVSSGYFSCHWCHVMQKESYQDQRIATIMNAAFIPVKIDREVDSALDDRLIDFVERTQGHAGWPLNVFITPDGYPLIGMTYVPPKNFLEVVNGIANKWRENKTELINIALKATSELEAAFTSDVSDGNDLLTKNLVPLFFTQASGLLDDFSGGFGEQNKFPSYPQLYAMLQLYKNKPDKKLKAFLDLTLERMASQGLNDQLSGGFYRYVVDPNWQIPHFEKMLYDNALLANLYLDAAEILENKNYQKVTRQTLDFLIKTFRNKKGGFIASLSAVDDRNVEGGYYLWKKTELKKILNQDEYRLITNFWNIKNEPELEAGHHFVEAASLKKISESMGLDLDRTRTLLASARKKLLATRSQRNLPVDDKVITSWNALLLTTFSKAAIKLQDKNYSKVAEQLQNYLLTRLAVNNELYRAEKNGKLLGKAGLEDYAYLVQALSEYNKLNPSESTLGKMKMLLQQAWQRYFKDKGWLLAENMLLKYLQVQPVIADGVLPSPSALIVSLSIQHKLALDKVKSAIKLGEKEILSEPFWYISQLLSIQQFREIK